MRAVLHALALVMRTSTMPALFGLMPILARPFAFVRAVFVIPLPAKRTAMPLTRAVAPFGAVSLARTNWTRPFARTRPGVTFSVGHTYTGGLTAGFGFGLGWGLGCAVGGVTGAVTSVDAHSMLFAPFVSLPLPVAVAQ